MSDWHALAPSENGTTLYFKAPVNPWVQPEAIRICTETWKRRTLLTDCGSGRSWPTFSIIFQLFLLKATSHLVSADLSHLLSGHASLASWCPTEWLHLAFTKSQVCSSGRFCEGGCTLDFIEVIKSVEWSQSLTRCSNLGWMPCGKLCSTHALTTVTGLSLTIPPWKISAFLCSCPSTSYLDKEKSHCAS